MKLSKVSREVRESAAQAIPTRATPGGTCRGQDGAVQGVLQRLQSFTLVDDGLVGQLVVPLRGFNELPPEVEDSGVAHLGRRTCPEEETLSFT